MDLPSRLKKPAVATAAFCDPRPTLTPASAATPHGVTFDGGWPVALTVSGVRPVTGACMPGSAVSSAGATEMLRVVSGGCSAVSGGVVVSFDCAVAALLLVIGGAIGVTCARFREVTLRRAVTFSGALAVTAVVA